MGNDPGGMKQKELLLNHGGMVGGVYRHYKGGLYTIVAVSLHEQTLEEMVTYRSNKYGHIWTRTIRNFYENVISGVPRFSRVRG